MITDEPLKAWDSLKTEDFINYTAKYGSSPLLCSLIHVRYLPSSWTYCNCISFCRLQSRKACDLFCPNWRFIKGLCMHVTSYSGWAFKKTITGVMWFSKVVEVQCSCVSCYIALYACKLMADGGRLTSTQCPCPWVNDLVPVSWVRNTRADSGLILLKVSTSRRVSRTCLFKKMCFSMCVIEDEYPLVG